MRQRYTVLEDPAITLLYGAPMLEGHLENVDITNLFAALKPYQKAAERAINFTAAKNVSMRFDGETIEQGFYCWAGAHPRTLVLGTNPFARLKTGMARKKEWYEPVALRYAPDAGQPSGYIDLRIVPDSLMKLLAAEGEMSMRRLDEEISRREAKESGDSSNMRGTFGDGAVINYYDIRARNIRENARKAGEKRVA